MLQIKALQTLEITLLPIHMGTSLSSLSTLKCLTARLPYYQAGLGNRLCYELTFNDYNQVIVSTGASPNAKYKITNISLEYEIVTNPNLAKHISDEYQSMTLLYDKVLRRRQIIVTRVRHDMELVI